MMDNGTLVAVAVVIKVSGIFLKRRYPPDAIHSELPVDAPPVVAIGWPTTDEYCSLDQ